MITGGIHYEVRDATTGELTSQGEVTHGWRAVSNASDLIPKELEDELTRQMLEKFRETSFYAAMRGSLSDGAGRSTWETDLFERGQRSYANARINRLQGRMSLAKGSTSKNRIELEMLRLSDRIRNNQD